MEQAFKDELFNILTLKKNEQLSQQLVENYGPFVHKITWNNQDPHKCVFFGNDIIKAYENGIVPEGWVERAKTMERTMKEPAPESDFYRVQKLLTDLGVGFIVKKKTPSTTFVILLKTGQPKVEGYGGFISEYLFDKDGSFIEIRIWD